MVAVGGALSLVPAVPAGASGVRHAGAAVSSTDSRVRFAETYLRVDGRRLTERQAVALVAEHPSIPTMAQASAYGLTSARPTVVVRRHSGSATGISGCSGIGAQFTTGSSNSAIWWWQNLYWCWDRATDRVSQWSQSGYPGVAGWAAWLWHYSGEVTGTGYPRWSTGFDPCDGNYVEYRLIVTFTAGWGPGSYVMQWDLLVRGYSDGAFYAGTF
jgi:hypothetical protein